MMAFATGASGSELAATCAGLVVVVLSAGPGTVDEDVGGAPTLVGGVVGGSVGAAWTTRTVGA